MERLFVVHVNCICVVDVQLVLKECNILVQVVNSNDPRVKPLIFTQLSVHDLIITDWSHKVLYTIKFLIEAGSLVQARGLSRIS